MRNRWLLGVCLGTLAWGQAPSGGAAMTPPAQASPVQASPAQAPGAASKAPAPAAELPEDTVVLTIKGVCPAAPKTAAAAKPAGTKATTTPVAKKPANCKTEITRAQFESIANGLSASVTPQLKRQLEQALPRFMAMSDIAKEKGLDKTPQFKQTLKVATMQILTTQLQHQAQDEADKVPAEKIAAYYKENPEAYEQFSLDRLFIPRNKQPDADDKEEAKEPEKLTDEQQKAKEATEKAKQEKGEQELTKLAESLRVRAAAGEDFTKLQKDAFEAAGTKVDNPTVNLPKVRRTGLPPAHAAVFDLKVGEVSAVITDNGGHYIYKVVSKEVVALDASLQAEIHNKLKSERLKEIMDAYTNSFEAVPNEAYFGPTPPPGARPGAPPRMQRPMMGQPQAQPQSAPPPAAGTPPSNPN
jgi:hypothetical protein